MPQRIVLIERELLLRVGLERMLASTPGMQVTGAAGTIAEAEQLPASTQADVVLCGTDITDLHGTQGVGRLLARFLSAQIVMLGPDTEPGLVIACFRAGADGYLTRNISPEGLVRALRGIEQYEVPLPRSLTYLLVEALRFTTPVPSMDEGALSRLSPREREVVLEISRGRSNAEIAQRLGVSESTVKTHVSNILRKTGSRSRFVLQAVGEA